MRDSRFIELLNLYVDHQLSSDDAAELEAEISRDPQRRRTYEQYCRIQKACVALFEQERDLAPESRLLTASLKAVDEKVAAGPRPISFQKYFYPIGVAAAACFAFVWLRHEQTTSNTHANESLAVNSTPAPKDLSTPVPDAVFAKAPAFSPRPGLYSVFATSNTAPAFSEDGSAMNVNSSADKFVSISWMRKVELAPLPDLSDRLKLETNAPATEPRGLRIQRTDDSAAERAAFQFQK